MLMLFSASEFMCECVVCTIVVFNVTFIISLHYNNNNNNNNKPKQMPYISLDNRINGSLKQTSMSVGCVALGNESKAPHIQPLCKSKIAKADFSISDTY